jgi:peptidoglycan/LPS O-acetylase OafA/YrhL
MFGGGFVGVDIFFVISGYLITSLILSEKEAGTFSLVGFYERRARRILPALFVVICCCLPFAWLWMKPSQLSEFAKSLMSVCIFSSNMEFWKETGYFAPAVDEKPLLHTWSLAVEEQYYVLFPLLVIFGWRYGQRFISVTITCCGLISFELAEYCSHNHVTANFYLLPTRAWELLIGAAVAIIILKGAPKNLHTNNIVSGLGLVLIISSIIVYDKTTPYPGVYAVIPTLGAAFVILCATPGTIAYRVLGFGPLVGLGVISYSVYLWHQPLLAFVRLRSLVAAPEPVLVGIALMSIPLAWITWLIVETPFRNKSIVSKRLVFTAMPTALVAIFSLGLVFYFHIGFSERNALLTAVEYRISPNYGLSPDCDYDSDFEIKPACETGPNPTLAVWGDSFAMHIVGGIVAANPSRDVIQVTRSACGPVLGLSPTDAAHPLEWAKSCESFNQSVFALLQSRKEITDVVLSSALWQYLNGDYDFVTDHGTGRPDIAKARSAFLQTISSLKGLGKRVTIVSPPALDGNNLGQCLYEATVADEALDLCDFAVDSELTFGRRVTEFLRSLEKEGGVRVVWLPRYTCTESTCSASKNGVFLYQDDRHLSQEGSNWIGSNTSALDLSPRKMSIAPVVDESLGVHHP